MKSTEQCRGEDWGNGNVAVTVGGRWGHYWANCVGPWPIVKRFGDNDLTLRATGPCGPDISKILPNSRNRAPRSATWFGKMAVEGDSFHFTPPLLLNAGGFKVRKAAATNEPLHDNGAFGVKAAGITAGAFRAIDAQIKPLVLPN